MNRVSHITTSAVAHKARLSVRTHAKDRTIPIQASQECGCIVSHALPTQALPSMTIEVTMNAKEPNLLDELIETMDELVDLVAQFKDEIAQILKELEANE